MKQTSEPVGKSAEVIKSLIDYSKKTGGFLEFRNYGGKLQVLITEKEIRSSGIKPVITYWLGNSSKFKSYYFPSMVRLQGFILQEIQALQEKEEYQKQRREEKKLKATKNRETVSVGDLFYTSTGYSMTLVNFYQVVEKKGSFVKIKEICSKTLSGNGGWEGTKTPIKDSLTGDEIRCKITEYGIKIKGNTAWKTVEGSEHFFSHLD